MGNFAANHPTKGSKSTESSENSADDARNQRPAERTGDGGTPRARSGNHTDHRRGDDDDRADMRKPGGEHRVPTTPNANSSTDSSRQSNRSGSDSGQ